MSVVEIAEDVWRCGGFAPVDGRLSWYPTDLRGLAPISCHVVRSESSVLIIDSGVAAHEQTVLDDVSSLLEPGDRVALALTRVVEFDSQGNAAKMLRRLPVVALYGNLPPHFILTRRAADIPPFRAGPDGTTLPGDPSMEGVELLSLDAGHELGRAAGFEDDRFVVIDAPLRLLKTAWIFDTVSGTLFTSDSFIHGLLAAGDDDPHAVLSGEDGALDPDGMAHVLTAKFEWLNLADTSHLVNELERIFTEHQVTRIAPGVGAVMAGRDRCVREGEAMAKALRSLGINRH